MPNINNRTKIKLLLNSVPKGTIIPASHLVDLGISHSLQAEYRKNGWINPVGRGAYTVLSDEPTLTGALYAVQCEDRFLAHEGGSTALEEIGMSQYAATDMQKRILKVFVPERKRLPSWFTQENLNAKFTIHHTEILKTEAGLIERDYGTYRLLISGPERAVLEELSLYQSGQSLDTLFQAFEMMTALRPSTIQSLLEDCSSIKAKRLFLWMADEAQLPWRNRLDLMKIDLGRSVCIADKGGKFNKKYNLIVNQLEET